jgi:hypothetical protein
VAAENVTLDTYLEIDGEDFVVEDGGDGDEEVGAGAE